MFADDLVLFCKADKISVECLMQAFHKFSQSSGLEANKDKSQIMLTGCGGYKKADLGDYRVQ